MEVLEKKEYTKIGNKTYGQIDFPFPLIIIAMDQKGNHIIYDCRIDDQYKVFNLPTSIKNVTQQQQDDPSFLLWKSIKCHQCQGQKDQELNGIKGHFLALTGILIKSTLILYFLSRSGS